MIRAVLFDIDGVLLDSFEANFSFFGKLMKTSGYPVPTREQFRPYFHFTMIDVIRALTGSTSETEIQRIFVLGKNGNIDTSDAVATMPAGSADVVTVLHKKYALGLVTSRIRANVFNVPAMAALSDCFQAIASFEDTEKHKPNPEPLLFAANQLHVKPQDCAYVGDVENDVIAARAAGMKAVIYSQKEIPSADACTPTFTDIPAIISRL